MTMQRPGRRREAGFAMLFVFLMAGLVAISLYMELPRVVFQAQRSREQLLIDRGEQYQRAIQLYFRRFRVYPPHMEALESTNNIRFLRRRYKDPMTGQDEWRLIRGLPNGVFLDSLVHRPPGQAAKQGETAEAGAAEAGVALWQQRRPSDMTLPPDPDQQTAEVVEDEMLPAAPGYPTGAAPGQVIEQTQQAGTSIVPVVGGAPGIPVITGAPPGIPSLPGAPPAPFGQPPVQVGMGQTPTAFQIQPVPGAQAAAGQPAGAANPALEIIRRMLTTPNPRGLAAIQVATGSPQPAAVAGIAGVASKLVAESIKVYNDRTRYNEWEFLYDARLDVAAANQMQAAPQQPVPPGPAGFGDATGRRPGRGAGGAEGRGMGPGGQGSTFVPFPSRGAGSGGGGRGGGIQPRQPNR